MTSVIPRDAPDQPITKRVPTNTIYELTHKQMEIPHDKVISDKDVLTEKYNIWRDELMTRLASWQQVEVDKKREPGKVVNQQGQKITISQVVEARKNLVREAVQYVQVLEELLNADQAGTLEDYWREEELQEGLILDNGISLPVKKGE